MYVRVQADPPVVTIITGPGGEGGDYAIRFDSAGLVVISSVKFLGSPGIISFDGVNTVIIQDSAFRSVCVSRSGCLVTMHD